MTVRRQPELPIFLPAWWRLSRSARRDTMIALVAVAALFLAVAVGCWWQLHAERSAQEALGGLKQDLAVVEKAAAEATRKMASGPLPWWTHLRAPVVGEKTLAETVATEALSLASKLELQTGRVSLSEVEHVTGAPYRSVTLRAELRGPYSDIKRWLSEVLARRPYSLALKSIDTRRAADGAVEPRVEATVELRLFERTVRTEP